MKKVITVLTAVMLSAASFSQVSFGVQGIGNLGNALFNADNLLNLSKKAALLPGAGLVSEIALGDKLALRTGINYLQHGFTLKSTLDEDLGNDITSVKFSAKLNLGYLQVPLNLLYKIPARYFEFYAGGGAYISYGINGKIKITTTTQFNSGDTEVDKEDQQAFTKESDGGAGIKRTDFGINALAGIKFVNGLFAHVGYQLGLSNNNGSDEGKFKNRGLQLSIGYFLFGK